MDLLCLFGRSGLAGTDGPYGLVSDDQFFELVGSEVENNLFDLLAHYVEMFAGFTFFEVLANAVDRCKVVGVSLFHFLIQRSAGFAVILAAFAVSEDYILDAERSDHLGRNLAGVGAFGFGGAVLGSYSDTGAARQLHDFGKVRVRGGHDEVYARANLAFLGGNLFEQFDTLHRSGVHFPVSCDNFLSHSLIISKLNAFLSLWAYIRFQSGMHRFCSSVPRRECAGLAWSAA